MNRRKFLFGTSSTFAAMLVGCGGAESAAPIEESVTTIPPLPPPPATFPGGALSAVSQSSDGLPALTLHPVQSGTLPYFATAFPAEGAVPAGTSIVSQDDPTLRASILSMWPDGSAQVAVVAGSTVVMSGSSKKIRLRAGPTSGTALTAADIQSRLGVNGIEVDFGEGPRKLANFGSPDWIWWANSQVICARYRLPCGRGDIEAVIDIHAFAGERAFVEVVIENGKVNASAATVTPPSTQPYTNATVKVNGTTIATVSSPTNGMALPASRLAGTYRADGHEPFRAWYCAAEVVNGVATVADQNALFGIEVTHDATSMQQHPWFWRPAVSSLVDIQTRYTVAQARYMTYQPWSVSSLRMPGMDGTGGDVEIGLHTQRQADYFQTGSKYARRAVLATGLALHSCAFNWRHNDGRVPTRAQTSGKSTSNGKWPETTTEPRYGGAQTADGSHIPSTTLVPFLCRPSPCFIELAQKETAWNQVDYTPDANGGHNYDQIRSRGWRVRNLGIATYLTPDWDTARKADYRAAITAESYYVRYMLDRPWNVVGAMYGNSATSPGFGTTASDSSANRPGYQTSMFMRTFVALAYHAVDKAKVLQGTALTDFSELADRVVAFQVKWVNDATGYEWRALPYAPTVGAVVSSTELNQGTGNLVDLTKNETSGTVPTGAGPWLRLGDTAFNYDSISNVEAGAATSGDVTYSGIFFNAICVAVERGVTGAESAWTAIYGTSGNGGITNFSTWLAGFGYQAHFNRWPRNK